MNQYSDLAMTFQEWAKTFKPQQNPFVTLDSLAVIPEGMLFNLQGLDHDHVAQSDERCIWTLIDQDGTMTIVDGYSLVNRHAYLLTKYPRPDKTQVVVSLDADPADQPYQFERVEETTPVIRRGLRQV